MPRRINAAQLLFEPHAREALGPGTAVLRGFMRDREAAILESLVQIIAQASFRHMVTPGGFRMSVAMTSCGSLGWVSDESGYRYVATDPSSGQAWPPMPAAFASLAADAAAAAGFLGFDPDACLINRYEPGARLTLHKDENERDFGQPIVSVSIGLPAVFLFGGKTRADKAVRIPVYHGDIVVWGGLARLNYHGVMPLAEGPPRSAYPVRYNLTFRKAD